jgi:excinuclease ABC subunit B
MSKSNLPENYEGIVYQIIRPTGLLDPIIEVRPSMPETFLRLKDDILRREIKDMPIINEAYWERTQIQDLIREVEATIKKGQRVLVTTLTKRMAEELSDFLIEKGIKSKYLHSDIDTVERVEILRDLRKGLYDVLVGINLLREGLDLPEVSLVAILDADKEGFLRSQTSLIQVIGRAARHEEGKVIMYADHITDSMLMAISETQRRRKIQDDFNKQNGITPTSIKKAIRDQLDKFKEVNKETEQKEKDLFKQAETYKAMSKNEQQKFKKEIKMQMEIFADLLEFEKAADLRDLMSELS